MHSGSTEENTLASWLRSSESREPELRLSPPQGGVEVCLVWMPYGAIERPSIALGLLQAALRAIAVVCRSLYLNVLFAEQIGLDRYELVNRSLAEELLGEWTFAGAAFPDYRPDHSSYFGLLAGELQAGEELLLKIREQAEQFINRVSHAVAQLQPRIVGCSSTFQQHCASLAILRRLKELDPDIITLMGGANCESSMGVTTRREFPWVDFVVLGEADEIIGDLCTKLLKQGRDLHPREFPPGVLGPGSDVADGEPGIAARPIGQAEEPARNVVHDLDALPVPDFEDYFEMVDQSPIRERIRVGLTIETARGCWWGEKKPCTFCGLNGCGMAYRSKSSGRAVNEFHELANRHSMTKFQAVDCILDMGHLDTVLPELAASGVPFLISYETKANLSRPQMERLADAGVLFVLPGLESLHDEFLEAIDKGTTSWLNVQYLKWAQELGIRVEWYALSGAPGEQDGWFEGMADWLPLIVHLQPPSAVLKITYSRFSSYHSRQDDFDISLTPSRAYRHVYPLRDEAVARLAYYFEDADDAYRQQIPRSSSEIPDSLPGQAKFRRAVKEWRDRFWEWQPPVLRYEDDGSTTRILDTRPCAVDLHHELVGLERFVQLACEQARSTRQIQRHLQAEYGLEATEPEVEAAIGGLVERRLLLRMGAKRLSLAVRAPVRKLPNAMDFPGGRVLTDFSYFSPPGHGRIASMLDE